MKPKLNMNFDVNIATLVLGEGDAITMTYDELQEVYKLLKESFVDLKEQINERNRKIV